MVLFYLTNSALDVTAGVLWWVTKNRLVIMVYHIYMVVMVMIMIMIMIMVMIMVMKTK